MFFVSDSLQGRQELIRSYVGKQAALGALLSVIDFEWTVRRAIIALGYQPTKLIRDDIEKCSGLPAYKEKWKEHVKPRFGVTLVNVIPNWVLLKSGSFPMRHKIVHGVSVNAKQDEAVIHRDIALAASEAICNFARAQGVDLYSRLPVRIKPVEIG